LYRTDCTTEATEIAGSGAACLLVMQCHPRGPAAHLRTVAQRAQLTWKHAAFRPEGG